MDILISIFGQGKDLTIVQVIARAVVIFVITLILIRISGRRSFGIKTPLDNIIVILLGAILSRAVVGASPFIPAVVASFILVILHRLLAWIFANSKKLKKIIDGDKILLFENGKFIQENLQKALLNEEEVMTGIRESALSEDLSAFDRIFIESSGQITVIKKQ
ncbi:MAG TPA: YetF domain-containing protein [Prolixibacteraceae bacterium]|jgi:uncharacterized membrane protein YcaP (DUF421 family)